MEHSFDMATAMPSLDHSRDRKSWYDNEARKMGYPSAADAMLLGAMRMDSDDEHIIYSYPLLLLEATTYEEFEMMKTIMTGSSEIGILSLEKWYGFNLRTISSEERSIHLDEVTEMSRRLLQHYLESSPEHGSMISAISRNSLTRTLSAIELYKNFIATSNPQNGVRPNGHKLNRQVNDVDMQRLAALAQNHDHPHPNYQLSSGDSQTVSYRQSAFHGLGESSSEDQPSMPASKSDITGEEGRVEATMTDLRADMQFRHGDYAPSRATLDRSMSSEPFAENHNVPLSVIHRRQTNQGNDYQSVGAEASNGRVSNPSSSPGGRNNNEEAEENVKHRKPPILKEIRDAFRPYVQPLMLDKNLNFAVYPKPSLGEYIGDLIKLTHRPELAPLQGEEEHFLAARSEEFKTRFGYFMAERERHRQNREKNAQDGARTKANRGRSKFLQSRDIPRPRVSRHRKSKATGSRGASAKRRR